MGMNSKDWLKAIAAAAATYFTAGAAAPALAGMMGGGAAGAAGTAGGLSAGGMFGLGNGAAAAAAGETGLGLSGMFSQIPGVAAGSEQAAALAAQTAEFGGVGADLTAKAAMPGVTDAFAAGKMGPMDYAMNVGKADLAGLNDPSVLGQRAMTNLGRMAGGMGKKAAGSLAMQGMFGAPTPAAGPAVPRPMPQQQAPAAPQMYGATPPPPGGGQSPQVQALIQRAMQGDQQALAELKRMGVA